MLRSSLTIAASIALTATGATVLTSALTDRDARAAVDRLVAAHHGALQVGGLDVDLSGGRLTLRDVALRSGSSIIYARRLTLPAQRLNFNFVSAAVAQTSAPGPSGSASASDVRIVHGAATYTIKKVDITGTALTDAGLAALLDPGTPDSLAARLQKIQAASIVLTDLTSETKTPGNESRAALKEVTLSHVADGKIAAVSIGAIAGSALAGDAAVTVATGPVQASNLDVALLERMIDTTRSDDAEPLRTLADSVTIRDLSLTNKGKATVTVAAITGKALRTRPLRTDLAAMRDAARRDGPKGDAERGERSKAAVDDLATSLEVGALSLDTLVASSGSEMDDPSRMSVASLALDGYKARQLAAFKVRNFLFQGATARIAFEGLDLADVVIPVQHKSADAQASAALTTDALPAITKADVSGIEVDATASKTKGGPSKVKFKLQHLGSTSNQTPGQVPTEGAVAVDHLTFDVPSSGSPGPQELTAMGYGALDLSGAITTSYDQGRQALSVHKLSISGAAMGSVDLVLDFDNVGKGILSANPTVAKASMLAMLLKRFDLQVANHGLVEKALEWRAKLDGKTVAEEQNAAANFFAVSLPGSMGDGVGVTTIGKAVATFIAAPRTLHIAAVSKDGLGVADLGPPDQVLDLLTIQADANK